MQPGGSWAPPPAPPVPPRVAKRRVSPVLTRLLQGLCVLLVLSNALLAAFTVQTAIAYDDLKSQAESQVQQSPDGSVTYSSTPSAKGRFDDAVHNAINANAITLLLMLVSALVLVSWHLQATIALRRHGVRARFPTAMAVFGWLIPPVNLLVPVMMMNDNLRIARAAGYGNVNSWRSQPVGANAWWVMAILAISAQRLSFYMAVHSRSYGGALYVSALASLIAIFSLALLFTAAGRLRKLDRLA